MKTTVGMTVMLEFFGFESFLDQERNLHYRKLKLSNDAYTIPDRAMV